MPLDPDEYLWNGSVRFGTENPERIRLRNIEWMVRSIRTPYNARSELGVDYLSDPHEGVRRAEWCFQRYGMSQTCMDDGRIICIAGEYEDSYDPDFCIYNDVVVLRPAPGKRWVDEHSGDVEVYWYPRDVFALTDFHAAVLVRDPGKADGLIYTIGNLGYQGTRVAGKTPIYTLDTKNYEIKELTASGDCPGWIRNAHASYDAGLHAITLRGGKVHVDDVQEDAENRAVYRLHLATMRWEKIADHERWREFMLERPEDSARYIETTDTFLPTSIPHTVLAPRPFWDPMWFSIDVMGIRVELAPCVVELKITIEGELPDDVVERLISDVRARVSGDGPLWTVEETTAE